MPTKSAKLVGELTPGALRVIEVLRRDVEPPDYPPAGPPYMPLRWLPEREKHGEGCCPMGLHEASPIDAPYSLGFSLQHIEGLESRTDCEEFAEWWDSQTDAKAAMDRVWPPQKRRRS